MLTIESGNQNIVGSTTLTAKYSILAQRHTRRSSDDTVRIVSLCSNNPRDMLQHIST